MKQFHKVLIVFLLVNLTLNVFAQASKSEDKTDEEKFAKNISTLKYGTESQVVDIVDTLKKEKDESLNKELLDVFSSTRNQKLKLAILDFFKTIESNKLETEAINILEFRDEEDSKYVKACFAYLAVTKSTKANKYAYDVLNQKEENYIIDAIKMLAKTGDDSTIEKLDELYKDSETKTDVKEEIILAYGKLKAKSSFPMLKSILESEDSSKVLRMYSCTALGGLKLNDAVDVLVKSCNDQDPNVRKAALDALANYKTKESITALRQGMRDDHVLPRIAAVKSVGELEDKDSVMFLEYKLLYDSENKVKEAALESLSKIADNKSCEIMQTYLANSKNNTALRVKCFGKLVLVSSNSINKQNLDFFIAEQQKKDRGFYSSLIKELTAINTTEAIPYIEKLLDDKESVNRLLAITWIDRNNKKDLKGKLSSFKTILNNHAKDDSAEKVRKMATDLVQKL